MRKQLLFGLLASGVTLYLICASIAYYAMTELRSALF